MRGRGPGLEASLPIRARRRGRLGDWCRERVDLRPDGADLDRVDDDVGVRSGKASTADELRHAGVDDDKVRPRRLADQSSLGTAAMLHVAAAFAEIDSDSFPADTIGPFYHEGDLLTKPLDLGPPYAKVPDAVSTGLRNGIPHKVVASRELTVRQRSGW